MPASNRVSFYNCTYNEFVAARDTANDGAGALEVGGLYFITDRGIIMKTTAADEAEEYGSDVKVVGSGGSLPATGVEGVLYIQIDGNGNYYGKVYNDASGQYDTVFAPASAPSGTVASGQTAAVSGNTVYTYINTTLGLTNATAVGGSSNAGKVVKLNASGLLDDSTMLSTTTTGGSGNSGKLVKLDSNGQIDNDMVPATEAGGSSNGGKIVKLTSSGVIAESMLPALAISSYITNSPSTYANLSNLTAQEGDWTTVTDDTDSNNGSYIKTDSGWQKLVDKYSTTSSVTENSVALVQSGAVYTAINNAALVWNELSAS